MMKTTRGCLDCGADISHRHGNAKRCELCSTAHQRVQASRNPDESANCFDRSEGDPCTHGKLRRLRCSKHYKRAVKAGIDLAPPQRACLACGEAFTPKRWDARHCSRRCTSTTHNLRSKPPTQTRNCAECGKLFPLTRTDRLTCSLKCSKRRVSRRSNKGIRDFLCAHCSSIFQAGRADALYCSDWCSRRAYYKVHRERLIGSAVRWAAEHPEEMRVRRRARRALKRNNPGSVGVSLKDWARVVGQHRGCCVYCGVKPDKIHMDHVIPLSRGGRHAIGNVLPACETCNLSKQACFVSEWKLRKARLARLVAAQSAAA